MNPTSCVRKYTERAPWGLVYVEVQCALRSTVLWGLVWLWVKNLLNKDEEKEERISMVWPLEETRRDSFWDRVETGPVWGLLEKQCRRVYKIFHIPLKLTSQTQIHLWECFGQFRRLTPLLLYGAYCIQRKRYHNCTIDRIPSRMHCTQVGLF